MSRNIPDKLCHQGLDFCVEHYAYNKKFNTYFENDFLHYRNYRELGNIDKILDFSYFNVEFEGSKSPYDSSGRPFKLRMSYMKYRKRQNTYFQGELHQVGEAHLFANVCHDRDIKYQLTTFSKRSFDPPILFNYLHSLHYYGRMWSPSNDQINDRINTFITLVDKSLYLYSSGEFSDSISNFYQRLGIEGELHEKFELSKNE